MISKVRHYLKLFLAQNMKVAEMKGELAEMNKLVSKINNKSQNDLKDPKINLGQIQSYFNSQKDFIEDLSEVEFQVFLNGVMTELFNISSVKLVFLIKHLSNLASRIIRSQIHGFY